MNITAKSVQIRDGLVQNYLQAYLNDPSAYIADLIFPRFKVADKTGKYAIIGSEARKSYDLTYAPGTAPATFQFSYSSGSYAVEDKAVRFVAPWDIMKNQQAPYDIERDAARQLSLLHQTDKELAVATMLTTAGNWGSNTGTPGTLWDANGNFALNIQDKASDIQKITSKRPNTFVCGRNVFEKIKENTYFADRNFLTGVGLTGDDAIKNALSGLIGMKVVIAEASYDTAVLGQTASNDWMYGKDAWILYIPQNAGLYNPSFGMQPFMDEPQVRSFTDDNIRSEVVEAFQSYDLVPNYSLGYHFDAVIS